MAILSRCILICIQYDTYYNLQTIHPHPLTFKSSTDAHFMTWKNLSLYVGFNWNLALACCLVTTDLWWRRGCWWSVWPGPCPGTAAPRSTPSCRSACPPPGSAWWAGRSSPRRWRSSPSVAPSSSAHTRTYCSHDIKPPTSTLVLPLRNHGWLPTLLFFICFLFGAFFVQSLFYSQ